MFQSIYEAYEVLSDLSLRQKYDNELRQENKNKVSTTGSASNSTGTTNNSYYSYTKTREESEFDFDDWLKEYLKREREKTSYNNDMYSLYELKNEFINIINISEENIDYNFYDKNDKIQKKTLKF